MACSILLELDTALSVRHTARGNGQSLDVRLVAVLRNTLRETVLLRTSSMVVFVSGENTHVKLHCLQ